MSGTNGGEPPKGSEAPGNAGGVNEGGSLAKGVEDGWNSDGLDRSGLGPAEKQP